MALKWSRLVLLGLILGVGLLIAGIGVYAARIHASAAALIDSARRIHSTADANREIATWRRRSGPRFWQESDHLGGDHNYDGQIENLLLARLGIVEPAAVTLGVTMHSGELRCVTLMMTAGRRPTGTPSVWVQEWFDENKASHFRVGQKDKPWAAIVEFSASVPEAQRDKALTLNTKCFVQFNGCKSAADILPGIWELEAPVSGDLSPNSSDLIRLHARLQ
jgi:hypothetical protein